LRECRLRRVCGRGHGHWWGEAPERLKRVRKGIKVLCTHHALHHCTRRAAAQRVINPKVREPRKPDRIS
jgi:hypothetical protein